MLGALARGPRAARAHRPHLGHSWLDTECELCGGCLSVCPTGAIYEKFVEGTERPERELDEGRRRPARSAASAARSTSTSTPRRSAIVKVTSDPHYVSNEGNLCVKGRFAFNFVHHPDRLTEPLVRGEDGELHPTTLGARAPGRGRRA